MKEKVVLLASKEAKETEENLPPGTPCEEKLKTILYLLITETPHNLLQKSTPVYTDPAFTERFKEILTFIWLM